jgi:hypothetical protein
MSPIFPSSVRESNPSSALPRRNASGTPTDPISLLTSFSVRGGSRTHKITRLSTWPLFHLRTRTRPLRRESRSGSPCLPSELSLIYFLYGEAAVRRAGVEPAMPQRAGGLQPLRHANAQPTRWFNFMYPRRDSNPQTLVFKTSCSTIGIPGHARFRCGEVAVDSSGLAPESSVCKTEIFLLDHEPVTSVLPRKNGSRGTRTHKRYYPSPVFKTGSSSGRMASQTIAGAGIEPADPWFKATDFYQQKLPRIESALRESNPPVQIGSLAPLPLGQGHANLFFHPQPSASRPHRDWDATEAVGLEPTTSVLAPAFEAGSSSSRMTSKFTRDPHSHRLRTDRQEGTYCRSNNERTLDYPSRL